MALWESMKTRLGLEPESQTSGDVMVALSELVRDHDVVEIGENGSYMVIAPKLGETPKKLSGIQTDASSLDMSELGRTGSTAYSTLATQEYNAQLRGDMGLRKFDEMRRSDAQVRAVLRLVKTPVLAARWFVEPASDSTQDRKVASFVWDNLTKYMSVSWPQLLTEILLSLDFGHYVFEKVWTIRDGKIIWKKMAPRHPLDIERWVYDTNGGPIGCVFTNDAYTQNHVFIPVDKLLIFTNDKEAGNIEGISVLRAAYKHWYYKDNLYKIDAIQKERHGIGIPCIKLPPNFNASDKSLADEMGRNLRTNEKAHIVLPPNWEILMVKMEGQATDAMASIAHHDELIARTVLGQFINNNSNSVEEQQQMFLKATRFIADAVRDVFNKYAIPQLVDYNWKTVTQYPELRVRRIGETVDWRTISFAIRNLIGAGVIVPDEALEVWMRDEMDLPKIDANTTREQEAPQGATGARVGPPRQSQASRMNISPGSNGRVGQDGTRQ